MGKKVRIDVALVDAKLVQSRERARALIMAGKVLVDGRAVTKAGTQISISSEIRLKAPDVPYVGRGGLKLAGVLDTMALDVSGGVFLDVGASTGGFTDCLLQRGAARIYAIDVGYGQLDWTLRNDPRVINYERVNARYLDQKDLPSLVDGVVMVVSFISVAKILPALRRHLVAGAKVLTLVKPQFEAGPRDVGKAGIVRDSGVRRRVVEDVKRAARDLGFTVAGEVTSPIRGAKGNVEYFLLLIYPGRENHS